MRFLSILILTLAIALQAQTADRLRWGPFTSSADSVTGIGIRGALSTKAGCVTRVTLDGEDVECATPTGTGAPVNAHGATLTGTTTADTLAVGTLLASDTSSFKPDMTADTLSVTDRVTLDYADANTDAVIDANKRLVSNPVTGTGSSVRSASPNLSGTVAIGSSSGIQSQLNVTGGLNTGWLGDYGQITARHSNTNYGITIGVDSGNGAYLWARNQGVGGLPLWLRADGTRIIGGGTGAASGITVSSSTVSSANKTGRFKTFHYDGVGASPVTGLILDSEASSNSLSLGGGSAGEYAVTAGRFLAAANNTTANGSIVGTWSSSAWTFAVPATFQSTLAVTGASTLTGLVSASAFNGGNKTFNATTIFHNTSNGQAIGIYGGNGTSRTNGSGIEVFGITSSQAGKINYFLGNAANAAHQFYDKNGTAHIIFDSAGRAAFGNGLTAATVTVTGATTLQSTLAVTGAITGSSTITATGNITGRRFITNGTGTSAFDTITANVLDIGTITGGGLFDSMEVDGPMYLPDLTASRPLYLDATNKIATGTWSGTGTVVPTTQGATLNNPTLTGTVTTPAAITMGSNTFTRSGAHALTLTTGAATNVTLPASGTLSTLAGTETLTNKSLTTPTLTGTTTAGRISSSDSISSALGVRTPYLDVSGSTPSHGIRVFTSASTTGAVHNSAVRVDNSFAGGIPRDVVSGMHVTITDNDGSADTTAGLYIGPIDGTNPYAIMSPTSAPSYFGGGLTVGGSLDLSDTLFVGGVDAIRYFGSGNSIEIGAGTGDGGIVYIGNPVTGGVVDVIAKDGLAVGGVPGVSGTCSSVTVIHGIVTGCAP